MARLSPLLAATKADLLAWALLPDHLHCLWTLPPGDSDYSTRWRLVKGFASRTLTPAVKAAATPSRVRMGEKSLRQRRFWEHSIRDARDYEAHCDSIHYTAREARAVPFAC